jgi:hypothetical protein
MLSISQCSSRLLIVLASTVGFWASSGPMTKFLFIPRPFICLEVWPLLRQEKGFDFLSRRHICCTVVSHECTHTHTASGYGHLYFTDTIHKIYTGHLSMQAFAAHYAITYFTTPKRQLVTWTVVGLTATNFKPLILCIVNRNNSCTFIHAGKICSYVLTLHFVEMATRNIKISQLW